MRDQLEKILICEGVKQGFSRIINFKIIQNGQGYHFKISARVDQIKTRSIVVMEMWQRKVTKLYSTTSNRNHITVIAIKSAADTFLFLHNNKSATANLVPSLLECSKKLDQIYFINVFQNSWFVTIQSH